MLPVLLGGTWSLNDIMCKVRLTTGRVDTSMMSDATLLAYVNYYYQYVLPKELKIFWGYTYFEFFCQANVDQYVAPSNFQTLNPQAWVDGWPITWYISPDTFYQDYPKQLNKTIVSQGDGVTVTFPFQIPAYPIVQGSLYVTDGTKGNTAVDNGNGGFITTTGSPLTGSINYVTGLVSVTFNNPPAASVNIVQSSETYMPNRPQSILFYKSKPLFNASAASIAADNMFVLRPIPDQTYLVKMEGVQVPAAFTLTGGPGAYSDVPFRTDLGPLIAYGASLEIFADFEQMEQYQTYQAQYNRYKDISMQDTYEEYIYTRSVPTF